MYNTKRYCLNCGKITEYKLNSNIGHSQCTICGLACGVKLTRVTRELIKELIKYKAYENKLEEYKGELVTYLRLRNKELRLNQNSNKGRIEEIGKLISIIATNTNLKKLIKKKLKK